MKKYESLYKELIDFHFQTKIWKSFSGLSSSKNEVKSFEDKVGYKFGESMNTYLQMVGNGKRFIGGLTMFNYQNIIHAVNNLKKRKIYNDDQHIELNSNNKLSKQFKEICCINHIDDNGYFTIVDPSEENPNLFGGEAFDLDFEYHDSNFTTKLRNEVFLIAKNICNAQRLIQSNKTEQISNLNLIELAQRVNCENYNWLKYYQVQYRNTGSRIIFNKLMEKEEMKNNSLFGHEEYELKYIEYQKSSGM